MSVNMAMAMKEKGWESHLIVSRKGGGMNAHLDNGVKIHYLNKRSFADLSAFWSLIRITLKFKPSVFHAHSTSIYWAVGVKILIGKFILIWHDHFGLSDQLDKYPRKDILVLSKFIDRIVTVNDKLLAYWQRLIPYKASSIRTIGNFPLLHLPDIEKFPRFTFLHLANFRPQKDQLTLIRSAKILVDHGLDFEILLVGELVDEDWADIVHDLIRELALAEYVKVIGPSSQVAEIMAKSHAGVLSSVSEGLPVALLEYGLAALPVVCTDVGDCAKVISEPEFGFVIPPANPELFANAMRSLMEKWPESQAMGFLLKAKVEKEYGKEGFLNLYFNLLNIN